jgi:hypothetical protein
MRLGEQSTAKKQKGCKHDRFYYRYLFGFMSHAQRVFLEGAASLPARERPGR